MSHLRNAALLFLLVTLIVSIVLIWGPTGEWELSKLAWERCVEMANIKPLRCGSWQEQREWFLREKIFQSAGALTGHVLLGLLLYVLTSPNGRGWRRIKSLK